MYYQNILGLFCIVFLARSFSTLCLSTSRHGVSYGLWSGQSFMCCICLLVVKPRDENVSFVTDKNISCKMKHTSDRVSGLAEV